MFGHILGCGWPEEHQDTRADAGAIHRLSASPWAGNEQMGIIKAALVAAGYERPGVKAGLARQQEARVEKFSEALRTELLKRRPKG